MALTSYTATIGELEAGKLRGILEERGFEFSEKPHALYAAKKGKCSVTVYEKGPKVLVQGKETEDFVKFVLEPEVLGEARLGYEEELDPAMFEPHFGIDESGKGDYFGPLVVAGAYTDRESARALLGAGVMDSKRVSSFARVRALAQAIRGTPGVVAETVLVSPRRYNELYPRFGNLNRFLAWGHAKVIALLAVRVPSCPRALSDQFARKEVLADALRREGLGIALEQRTKGESDVAVAAASILAREKFVDWMEKASEKGGVELPLGAGEQVLRAARALVERDGEEILGSLAKLHFKTTGKL